MGTYKIKFVYKSPIYWRPVIDQYIYNICREAYVHKVPCGP